jgi:hydroxymethylbilane synthase
MNIRIATRRSALALWQAEHVAAALRRFDDVGAVELVPLTTRGDEVLDRSLQKIGGKGLFIKELEVAMHAGDADIAVHSMKDVPAEMPDGFCIAATLARANCADALVAGDGMTLGALAEGAHIGTSSLRRQAQIRLLRPDVSIGPLRGNVNTRLAKLDAGDFDAIVLAAAGLERLGLQARISQQFSPDQMLPAVAQGVIGIECLASDDRLRAVLGRLHDETAARTTAAERAVARTLEASCQSPIATLALIRGEEMSIAGLVAMPDGSESIRAELAGPADNAADAERLGERLARQLLARGAGDILAALEAADG